MTSLTSYLSSDYQKAYNLLFPKSAPKTILVYVESIEDISFWHNILAHYEEQAKIKFDIQAYSNNSLDSGKRNLEQLFDNTGEYLIICLDSDYDYLLPESSTISKKINENPYIFQTYVYSMENLKCYAESLSDICVQATHNTSPTIDFSALLKLYSKIIHELFIWNLYFYKIQDTDKFSISTFCSLVKVTKEPKMDEYGHSELKNIEALVNNKVRELKNNFPEHIINIGLFTRHLNDLGLNDTNAYLFIHGHTLYNNFVLFFIRSAYKKLKKDHEENIKILAKNEQEKKYRLNNYRNSVKRIEDILSTNNKFKQCVLFKKIEKDIEEYLKISHFTM